MVQLLSRGEDMRCSYYPEEEICGAVTIQRRYVAAAIKGGQQSLQ